MKKTRSELIDVPNYDDASDFLTPAGSRDLRAGIRLYPSEAALLLRFLNHTYGKPKSAYEPTGLEKSPLKRLLALGYVEKVLNPRTPHWAQEMSNEHRITEKGAMRLLDPEALIAREVLDL